jgi:Transposase and inactivated derivatives
MQDKELYQNLLGLRSPWFVSQVDLRMEESKVTVWVEHLEDSTFPCPECGLECTVHDHRRRTWRHLDTCGLVTMIECDVPRVRCDTHGVLQARVPWAEPRGRFTALFEAVAISWLKVAPIKSVAERLALSWDEAWGIMDRAVKRGLARRDEYPIKDMGIDETSFQKRHEYVTVLIDRASGNVIDILDDRKKSTLREWLEANKERFAEVRTITMDMWDPYISAVLETIEGAETKICFDRFHVAAHFGKALDTVRATEHKALRSAGGSPLTRTKYDWLRTRANGGYQDEDAFMELTRLNLKTARAWRIKEAANGLWAFFYRAVAERHWKCLLAWISRCRLEPMMKVGRMVKANLWGILNAIVQRATNAMSESINAGIQKIKAQACGFRNRARFRIAILFHRGGLSMLPLCDLHG